MQWTFNLPRSSKKQQHNSEYVMKPYGFEIKYKCLFPKDKKPLQLCVIISFL